MNPVEPHSDQSEAAVVCPSFRVRGDTAVEVFSPAGVRYSIRYVGIGHPWHTIGPDGGRVSTDAEYALAKALIAAHVASDEEHAGPIEQEMHDSKPWRGGGVMGKRAASPRERSG